MSSAWLSTGGGRWVGAGVVVVWVVVVGGGSGSSVRVLMEAGESEMDCQAS